MSTTANNETLERIKNEVAKEKGWTNWIYVKESAGRVAAHYEQNELWPIVCKRFARAVAIDSLKEAAENVTVEVTNICAPEPVNSSMSYSEKPKYQILETSGKWVDTHELMYSKFPEDRRRIIQGDIEPVVSQDQEEQIWKDVYEKMFDYTRRPSLIIWLKENFILTRKPID